VKRKATEGINFYESQIEAYKKLELEERNKTWKYFWQQKAWEIASIPAIIFVPWLIGKSLAMAFPKMCSYNKSCSNANIWGFGGALLTILGFLVFINWIIAKERAREND